MQSQERDGHQQWSSRSDFGVYRRKRESRAPVIAHRPTADNEHESTFCAKPSRTNQAASSTNTDRRWKVVNGIKSKISLVMALVTARTQPSCVYAVRSESNEGQHLPMQTLTRALCGSHMPSPHVPKGGKCTTYLWQRSQQPGFCDAVRADEMVGCSSTHIRATTFDKA